MNFFHIGYILCKINTHSYVIGSGQNWGKKKCLNYIQSIEILRSIQIVLDNLKILYEANEI